MEIKKNILFGLLFISAFYCSSQSVNKTLIGSWLVKDTRVESSMIPEEQIAIIEVMQESFKGAKFTFNADGTFLFTLGPQAADIMKELLFVNNTNWIYDESKSYISIGTKSDGYSLMGILVRHKDGMNYFILDESPIMLHVQKT